MSGLPDDVVTGGLDEATLERITADLLQSLASDEAVDPHALIFLLRRYGATDRADLAAALGPALARALEPRTYGDSSDQLAPWLMLFTEAAGLSDDPRVRTAAADLVTALRREWARVFEIDAITWSIDACLMATAVFDPRELVPHAIDELERVIGAAYRPGGGIAHYANEPHGARGGLGDHVRAASALLTAYSITGRLPYAMLAEELMQFARRTLWDAAVDAFDATPPAEAAGRAADRRADRFVLNCEAARVLCRLASLHDDAEYRKAAVIAPDADYRMDAARILASLEPSSRERGLGAAIFGVALGEWMRP